MRFEDRLRANIQRAGETMPGGALDLAQVMGRVRRQRVMRALTAVAVALVVGVAGGGAVWLAAERAPGLRPIVGPTETTEPTSSPTPTETLVPSPTPTPAAPACSASELSPRVVPQEGLPAPVADVRRAIVALAVACDYDGLAELADRGDDYFTYSFGGGEDFAGFLRFSETEGTQPLMAVLVKLMNLSYCEETHETASGSQRAVFQWPAAFCDGATRSDNDEVIAAGLYTEEDFAGWREGGANYVGLRAAITEFGNWIFFVAGD